MAAETFDKKTKYTYRMNPSVWWLRIGAVVAALACVGVVGRLVADLVNGTVSSDYLTELASTALGCFLAIMMSIDFPNVWIADDGMWVSTYLVFGKRFIPWSDIVGLSEIVSGSMGVTRWTVFVRKLTWRHRLVMRFLYGKRTPGFYIWSLMPGHIELLDTIRARAENLRQW